MGLDKYKVGFDIKGKDAANKKKHADNRARYEAETGKRYNDAAYIAHEATKKFDRFK